MRTHHTNCIPSFIPVTSIHQQCSAVPYGPPPFPAATHYPLPSSAIPSVSSWGLWLPTVTGRHSQSPTVPHGPPQFPGVPWRPPLLTTIPTINPQSSSTPCILVSQIAWPLSSLKPAVFRLCGRGRHILCRPVRSRALGSLSSGTYRAPGPLGTLGYVRV